MKVLSTFIDVAGSIGWGIFIAALLGAITLGVALFRKKGEYQFTLLSFAISAIMVSLLAYQCTFMMGAIRLKNTCHKIETTIDELMPKQNIVGPEEAKMAIAAASAVVPMVADLTDIEALTHYEQFGSFGQAATHKVQNALTWFIFRRIIWSVLFIALGLIGITYTMEIRTRTRNRRQSFRRRRR